MAELEGIPHNFEAEQKFLGAVLAENRVMDRARDFLEDRHFYDPLHGRIYHHIEQILNEGGTVRPTTLRVFFSQDEEMRAKGGDGYLSRLVSGACSLIEAESYAHQIHALAQRRELLAIGRDISARASEIRLEDPPSQQITDAEAALYRAAERSLYEGGFEEMRDLAGKAAERVKQARESDRHISGLPTDLRRLDESLGGLQPSDLVIIAGRTGMGKTSLGLSMAMNIARASRKGKKKSGAEDQGVVGFFSLEMSSEQLALRLAAGMAGVSAPNLREGRASEEEYGRVLDAFEELHEMPLHIDDTGSLSIAKLISRARRLKREHKVDVIFVDYLQLVTTDSRRYGDNRVREVGEITQGLKALAKDLDIPIVALAQLSRAVDARESKRPQLSDLRESGSIEQDADIVLFIHREEYYLEQKEPSLHEEELHRRWEETMSSPHIHGVADIIIGKHRHGSTGSVKMHFDKSTTRFTDLAPSHFSSSGNEDSDNGGWDG